MSDQLQSPPPSQPSSPTTISAAPHHKPHITWSDPYTKALNAISSLSPLLPSPLPSSLSSASHLLHDPVSAAHVSSLLLLRPDSGASHDPLCAWLYDTFHSADPDLRLIVLRSVPALAAAYLAHPSLSPGFESVLLALYAHETAARAGQAATVHVPDLAHPSIYHETNQTPSKNASTELRLAVVSPRLDPHGTVRSTRRARIVGVAVELYYGKIHHIPVGSKIEFCQLCRAWSGQEDSIRNDIRENSEGRKKIGRIDLPWELLQPILRIIGHCLMGPEKNEELFQAALSACRCLHGRAVRDINSKAILATGSLVKLGEMEIENRRGGGGVDYTEIAMSNVITI